MRTHILHTDANPQVILIQLTEAREREMLQQELAIIQSKTNVPFLFAAIEVDIWNDDLSPWQAAPVFGKEGFGGNANKTLHYVEQQIDILQAQFPTPLPVILGGYSLAGLFALWAATHGTQVSTPAASFSAIAAASPSVWFDGWDTYAATHPIHAQAVYLSLGDKEDRSRHPLMREVKNCIELQAQLLQDQGIPHTLEWNQGNHFQDAPLRTAQAFIWCMEQILN